jgi:CHAD domain-containing protein
VKARTVKGLDPAGPLADNAERIARARLDELWSFAPAVLDPRRDRELHDMRIAAKRLRYVLEVTGHLFGPYTAPALRRAKELQALLGEIHDCDEMLPRVRKLIAAEHAAEVLELRARARDGAGDLDAALAAGAPRAEQWRGLHAYAAWLEARRAVLHDAFCELWTELGRAGFRARLEFALAERAPEPEPAPPDPDPDPDPDTEPALAARTAP